MVHHGGAGLLLDACSILHLSLLSPQAIQCRHFRDVHLLRVSLFPAIVHLPVADARAEQDAFVHHPHRCHVQHVQCHHARWLALLFRTHECLSHFVVLVAAIHHRHRHFPLRHGGQHLCLRKNDMDNNYYLPDGWMFRRINSANYLGEVLEWLGFAILTWSVPGLVFLIWTFANIVPRSKAVYERYTQFFGEEFTAQKRYKIFPGIY